VDAALCGVLELGVLDPERAAAAACGIDRPMCLKNRSLSEKLWRSQSADTALVTYTHIPT
jgi:hypothetical protein